MATSRSRDTVQSRGMGGNCYPSHLTHPESLSLHDNLRLLLSQGLPGGHVASHGPEAEGIAYLPESVKVGTPLTLTLGS